MTELGTNPESIESRMELIDRHHSESIGKELSTRFGSHMVNIEAGLKELDITSFWKELSDESLKATQEIFDGLRDKKSYFYEETPGNFKLQFKDSYNTPPMHPKNTSYSYTGPELRKLSMALVDSFGNALSGVNAAAIMKTRNNDNEVSVLANEVSQFMQDIEKLEEVQVSTDETGETKVAFIPKEPQEVVETP